MNNQFTIALTGGIASGKTTVSDRFAQHTIEIVDADQIARELVRPGQPLLETVVEAFGAGFLTVDGELDRARLRKMIFAEPGRRRELEDILHPAIHVETVHRIEAAESPYVIVAIPLLIETGCASRFSRILVIDVPADLQRKRLLQRDRVTEIDAARILDAQASRADRLRQADDVIRNTGSIEQLMEQVDRLHHEYSILSSTRNCSHDAHDAQSALS